MVFISALAERIVHARAAENVRQISVDLSPPNALPVMLAMGQTHCTLTVSPPRFDAQPQTKLVVFGFDPLRHGIDLEAITSKFKALPEQANQLRTMSPLRLSQADKRIPGAVIQLYTRLGYVDLIEFVEVSVSEIRLSTNINSEIFA
ncbi:MAG: hypothetical protein AAGF45_11045 [Pseudomonadota bacterium]